MGFLGEKNDGISPEMNRELSRDITKAEEGIVAEEHHVDLHRDLKARHITMIGTLLCLRWLDEREELTGLSYRRCYRYRSYYWNGRSSCEVSPSQNLLNANLGY